MSGIPHEVWANAHRIRVITVHVLREDTVDVQVGYGCVGYGTVRDFSGPHLRRLRQVAMVLPTREKWSRDLTKAAAAKRVALLRERWTKDGFEKLATVSW